MDAVPIIKKGQESPVKGHNCGFLPLIFPSLRHLEQPVSLEFLVEKIRHFISPKGHCVQVRHAKSGHKKPWRHAQLVRYIKSLSKKGQTCIACMQPNKQQEQC